MLRRKYLELSQYLLLALFAGTLVLLDVALGVYHVIKVTNFVKLGSLNCHKL